MELYNYKATVVRVVDGDTVKLKIDLGFCVEWVSNCRLAGINAPEINTESGKKADAFLSDLLPKGTVVRINSKKLDKYGRPIVEIFILELFGHCKDSVNKILLDAGFAEKYDA